MPVHHGRARSNGDVERWLFLKICLLGPVAWRTPPRHYGPWEQVTSLLAEGLAARGVDVTLFATLDSLTSAKLDGVCARATRKIPQWTGGSERHSTFPRSVPLGRLRPRSQPPGLVAARLRRPREGAAPHHHPRLFRARDPPRLRERARVVLRLDLGRRSRAGARLRGDHPPWDRPRRAALLAGRRHGSRLPGGSTPTRERRRRSTSRAARAVASSSAGSCRTNAIFTRRSSHIDGDRVVFLGSVGPSQRAEVLALRRRWCTGRFRRAFGLSVVEAMACGTR